MENTGVLRGRGLPRCPAMERDQYFDNETPCHEEQLCLAAQPYQLPPHQGILFLQPNWTTLSCTSTSSNGLSSLPTDVQQWYRVTVEFAERLRLESEISEQHDDDEDEYQKQSWMTDTAGLLKHLDDITSIKPSTVRQSLPSTAPVKRQRRNAVMFSPHDPSVADLWASSIDDTDFTDDYVGSSTGNMRQSSSRTLLPRTSGGYREAPGSNRRDLLHHHSQTLIMLEGKGPFVLDAGDISVSQVRGTRSSWEPRGSDVVPQNLGSLLIDDLQGDAEDNIAVEEEIHGWTSGVFGNMENEIISLLDNMEGEDAVEQQESQSSSSSSRSVGISLPPLAPVAPIRSKKERFGKLGHWWKNKVLRRDRQAAATVRMCG